MKEFWNTFRQSYIISGILACSLAITACILWVTNRPVPDELHFFLGMIFSFYMGAKSQATWR